MDWCGWSIYWCWRRAAGPRSAAANFSKLGILNRLSDSAVEDHADSWDYYKTSSMNGVNGRGFPKRPTDIWWNCYTRATVSWDLYRISTSFDLSNNIFLEDCGKDLPSLRECPIPLIHPSLKLTKFKHHKSIGSARIVGQIHDDL